MRKKHKLFRTYQKGFTKLLRKLNKSIADDDLWLGRFEFRQQRCSLEEFSDGSGGILYVTIRAYDKKTQYYKDYNIEYAPYLELSGYKIWEIGNRFIVEDSEVWKEMPSPRDETFVKDYRKIHMPDEKMRLDRNYFLSYSVWVARQNTKS